MRHYFFGFFFPSLCPGPDFHISVESFLTLSRFPAPQCAPLGPEGRSGVRPAGQPGDPRGAEAARPLRGRTTRVETAADFLTGTLRTLAPPLSLYNPAEAYYPCPTVGLPAPTSQRRSVLSACTGERSGFSKRPQRTPEPTVPAVHRMPALENRCLSEVRDWATFPNGECPSHHLAVRIVPRLH